MGIGGRPGAPIHADAADFAARALQDARADIVVITTPAPTAPPEHLFRTDGPALFWTTPGAPVHVGLGAAATITATGDTRFRTIREHADTLWRRVTTATLPGTTPLRPRLFGGFSFLPGAPTDRWRAFGDATFLLPRLLYTVNGAEARLSLALTADERRSRGIDAIVEELGSILEQVGSVDSEPASVSAAGTPAAAAAAAASDSRDVADDREEWARGVASIQRRIADGLAEKIVAARSRAIPLPPDADIRGILRRMDRESSTAARFAFCLGGDVFLGATPERLVSRRDGEVRTEALAGSIAADSPEREERLLASLKEEVEHDYVVQAIVEALEPLCETLDYPDEPRVQRLRHVLHLQTPFIGRLARPVHVLDLVERLHPTPAVGGRPTAEALEWIDSEEPGSRGWYAAPVGWFDEQGGGDFGVALRSALIHEGLAHLFAGAGIVGGSDAASEYDETEVKLRTMLDALEAEATGADAPGCAP